MAVQVSVENAGQESGIGIIGMGVGAPLAIAVASRCLRWDQIDDVASVQQEIHQQVVGGLNSKQTFAGRHT